MTHDHDIPHLAALTCVDLERWPIHKPKSDRYLQQIAAVRAAL